MGIYLEHKNKEFRMKKVIAASVMALALATSASAEVKVGLGYTLSSANGVDALFATPANIRVPIDFDFGLRIEPELGFGSGTDDGNNQKEEFWTRTIAVGGYYNLWAVEKVNFYAGGRLAYTSGEVDTTNKNTGVLTTSDFDDTSLQGLFGAEYMFTQDFSFGAQAGLEFKKGSYGNNDTDSVGTVGHILVHYFF